MQGLTLKSVSFAYPRAGRQTRREVLKDVSATIPLGKITAVVGPNGAGKSTLLRLMLGTLTPTEGQVTLGGEEVGAIPASRRASRLAYVSQRAELSEAFSVRQAVRLGRHAVGDDEAAVERALREVDLLDRADEPMTTLSAGQQQRATLARALAQLSPGRHAAAKADHPRILIADEPMSALDPAHVLSTIGLLRRFVRGENAAAEGSVRGVVVVIHDFTAALRLADHALVLDEHGSLAAAGPASEALSPDILSRVFGVTFRHIPDPAGTGVLVATS